MVLCFLLFHFGHVLLVFLADIPDKKAFALCRRSPFVSWLEANPHQELWAVLVLGITAVPLLLLQPISLPAGTSPHAPTSVHVVVAMTSANVSWEPGYDGGYEQTFSVWYGPL